MWLCMIIVIVIIFIIMIFINYNKIIKLNNKVKEAFSTTDVYLKKRWDLIPNIVEIVKGYTKYEKETLEEIVQIRNNIYDNMSNDEKISVNNKIIKQINKIMYLVETYLELKANENFEILNNRLAKIEDEIANSRKYYNATVRDFNNKVEMFPSNIVAMIFGYKTKKMFEINSLERKNLKVNL